MRQTYGLFVRAGFYRLFLSDCLFWTTSFNPGLCAANLCIQVQGDLTPHTSLLIQQPRLLHKLALIVC
jgi:hypothetical protein